MNKSQRERLLIEVYQKWIQPKLNSNEFPELSDEDILKTTAKSKWGELYKKQRGENKDEKIFKRNFEKINGKKPESLISKEGWFLISNHKEKDVASVHYSFGFEDYFSSGVSGEEYWVEIALNSVETVEQFLAMDSSELGKLFLLCKEKQPRMLIRLSEKKKRFYGGNAKHTKLFEKEMCYLTEQDLEIIRMKANKINNLRDPLIKPFIGLCVVEHLKKEDLAECFGDMQNVFNFIMGIVPRKRRYQNARDVVEKLEKEKAHLEKEIPRLKKDAVFWKNLGKFETQEKLEMEIIKSEQRLDEITQSIKNEQLVINLLVRDMKKND